MKKLYGFRREETFPDIQSLSSSSNMTLAADTGGIKCVALHKVLNLGSGPMDRTFIETNLGTKDRETNRQSCIKRKWAYTGGIESPGPEGMQAKARGFGSKLRTRSSKNFHTVQSIGTEHDGRQYWKIV